tara:strand:- start:225 stop:1388 length:1164 start_codon:yes stop_codon:yes gene_type:complete
MSELKVNSIKGVGASTAAISIDNSSGTCTANITNNLSNRNLIINGAMQIAQRGTSFTSAASNTYVADRWLHERSSSAAFTISQSTDAPVGYKYSIKAEVTTADTSIGGSEFNQFYYKIEANDISHLEYGTANAKTCTLSFWAKHSLTGTYPLGLQNHNGSRVYPATYTINNANTWEYKTITFAGDTGGTWNTSGNSLGLRFNFCWNLGSSFTGGTAGAWAATTGFANFASTAGPDINGTVGNTVQWAGVQLEVGSVATDFEHLSYTDTLAKCQRYFYLWKYPARDAIFLFVRNAASTLFYGPPINLPTVMRAISSVTYVNSGSWKIVNGGSYSITPGALFNSNVTEVSSFHLYFTWAGSSGSWDLTNIRSNENNYTLLPTIQIDGEL